MSRPGNNFIKPSVPILITCVIFGFSLSLLIVYVLPYQTVVYTLDEWNSCTWKDGSVELTTAVNGPQKFVTLNKKDEAQFLKTAEENGDCVYPGKRANALE